MKPLTHEWLAKAEEDHRLAVAMLHQIDPPSCDGAAFHAQQSAEKYLKALLQEQGVRIPKSHELHLLVEQLHPPQPDLQSLIPALRRLSELAILSRYPGYFADLNKATQALDTATRVRSCVRSILHW